MISGQYKNPSIYKETKEAKFEVRKSFDGTNLPMEDAEQLEDLILEDITKIFKPNFKIYTIQDPLVCCE